jgi:carboxypeptidase family protein
MGPRHEVGLRNCTLTRRRRVPAFTISLGVVLLLLSLPAPGQVGATALSGTISDASGKAIPNARVSVKNLATGQIATTQSDAAGAYAVSNLAPGDYEVSASADGFVANVTKVTLSTTAETANLALAGGLSLQDLGFTSVEAAGSNVDQATLDKRSHMLKVHQTLGLITIAPLAATLITSGNAGSKNSTSSDRTLHAALGATTAVLYCTSAYYAIFAPKIPGTTTKGPIKLHKALAWIHGVGMVLTPILGILADEQRNKGEKVHGIASAHGAVAAVTAAAYGAAILSVSIKL